MRDFFADERGNIAIIAAIGLSLVSVVGALMVDSASLYFERRGMQAAVDLASIASARNPNQAFALARETLVDSGVLPANLTAPQLANPTGTRGLIVTPGRYEADPAVLPADRFVPNATPHNAVRVDYHQPGALHFAQAWSTPPRMSVSATATTTPIVAFSVGSRLASLNGGIANVLLNRLLGSGLSLSLLDYESIASVDVGLFDFLDALALELGVTVGSYNQLLDMDVNRRNISNAVMRLLVGPVAGLAATIGNAAPLSPTFKLSRLINLGDFGAIVKGERPLGINAGIPALDLIAATIGLGGDSHLDLGISASLPGLVGVTASVVVGEPLQHASAFAVGPGGTVVRTAQVRVRLRVSLLGTPVLLGAGVNLPIYLDVASASASVVSASCPSPGAPNGSAVIAARPGLVRLAIGTVGNFTNLHTSPPVTPVKIIDALLINVTAKAVVEIANPSPTQLSFSSQEIDAGTVKTAATRNITQSLIASLMDELVLTVQPLGLSLGAITGAVKGLVSPVTPVLDSLLLTITGALGIGLGEADIRVYGVTCNQPVLVG